MAETDDFPAATLSGRVRLTAIVLALGVLGLLVTAALLKPAPGGLGTHQQFGLPPCTFRVLFDRRCPSCGMTTSWAHLVRGQPIDAVRASAGGTLLGILAMIAVPWLSVSAAVGRWIGWVPNAVVVAWVASAIVLATLIDWGLRLAAG